MFSSARDRIFLFTRLSTAKLEALSVTVANNDTAFTVSSSLVIKELLST